MKRINFILVFEFIFGTTTQQFALAIEVAVRKVFKAIRAIIKSLEIFIVCLKIICVNNFHMPLHD